MIKEVECYYSNCISWRKANGCADNSLLIIGDEGCENFVSYKAREDYQTEYWIACLDKETDTKCRRKLKGKRVEIEGFVFFTEDNIEEGYYECEFTEEKTGVAVPGMLAFTPTGQLLDEVKEKIIERIANEKPVMELPIWKGEQDE